MESTHLGGGLARWFSRHKRRIGTVAVGHTAKRIEEFLFDWLLYGVVVLWATNLWGPWYGSLAAFVIMAPLSALVCFAYVLLYDWAKIDWFGFEFLKEWRDEARHEHWAGRLLHRITRFGAVPAFFVLSVHGDPFLTTVYFRHKHAAYRGLSRRDWSIFGASVLVSNAYWTLRWTVILALLQLLWRLFVAPTV